MKVVIPLQTVFVAFLLLGISVFIGVTFNSKTAAIEPFQTSQSQSDIQLQACPPGTQTFNQEGDTLCCDGDLQNGQCNGRTVCSLSSNTDQMPSCLQLLRNNLRDKAVRFCPPTAQNYYEKGNEKGCTSGLRTVDGSAPLSDGKPVKICKIYSTDAENARKLDSCSNIKLQDTIKCPQGETPGLASLRSDLPAVLTCTIRPFGDPYPRNCYEDTTFTNYLNGTKEDWKSKMNFDEDLQFCSKAKAFYIDKTLVRPLPPLPPPVKAKCIFNARQYADKYPDLKRAFGYNEAALKKHYVDFGIREGREYTPGCRFDALRYAELNADLRRAFGYDTNKLLNHYKQFGINENREINKL